MQKREKIGIIVVVILLVILVATFWTNQTTNPTARKINCATACHQIGNGNWIFPGGIPISKNISPSQNDCISACQARFGK